MPPIDGPTTQATRLDAERGAAPRSRRAAMSSSGDFREGDAERPARCAGRSRPGSTSRTGLPIELMQTTKNRRVSIGLPAPIIDSHQPGFGSAGDDAACADGDSPVKSSTVLSRAAFSVPQALVGDDRVLDHAAAIQAQRLVQQGQPGGRQVVGGSWRCSGDGHEHASSLDPARRATSLRG